MRYGLIAAAALVIAGAATAQPALTAFDRHGVTCASFTYQEDAQANYHTWLDADGDGVACEALPRRPIAQPPVEPVMPPMSTDASVPPVKRPNLKPNYDVPISKIVVPK